MEFESPRACYLINNVTPHAGVWIEINKNIHKGRIEKCLILELSTCQMETRL